MDKAGEGTMKVTTEKRASSALRVGWAIQWDGTERRRGGGSREEEEEVREYEDVVKKKTKRR